MSDISNRTIVALLAVALVVSVAGTMYSVSELGQVNMVFRSISGLAQSGDGNVTLNVSEVVSILVHNPNPVLAAGSIKAGTGNYCEMGMGGDPAGGAVNMWHGVDVNIHSANCEGGFNDSAGREGMFHLLENNGNVEANETVKILGVQGAGLGANLCAFLTGINDSDPTDSGTRCYDGIKSTEIGVMTSFAAVSKSVNDTHGGNASIRQHFDNIVTEDDQADTRPSAQFTTKVDLTDAPQQILGYFRSDPAEDEAAIGFTVKIPAGALPGARTAKLVYEATPAN